MKSGIRIIRALMRGRDEARRKAQNERALQEHMRIALEAYLRRLYGKDACITSVHLTDAQQNADGSVTARVILIRPGRSD